MLSCIAGGRVCFHCRRAEMQNNQLLQGLQKGKTYPRKGHEGTEGE